MGADEFSGWMDDLDSDHDFDGSDLALLISDFGCTSGCSYDLTGDGEVNAADLPGFALHYGEICP